MTLTKEEKQNLLIDYFNYELSKANFKKSSRYLNKIGTQIPARDLYDVILSIYDQLNEKHAFNQEPSKRNSFYQAIEKLISHYESLAYKQTKQKALRSTILFSLFIVTLPFAIWFYNKKVKAYYQQQDFQYLSIKSYLYKEQSNEPNKNPGLLNRLRATANEMDFNFKTVLFSKKNNVRKILKHQHDVTDNKSLIFTLLGSRNQIENIKEKCMNRSIVRRQTFFQSAASNTITQSSVTLNGTFDQSPIAISDGDPIIQRVAYS